MDFIDDLILEHIKEIGEDRVLLTCSTSACDHNWSIEGWIHSNRRNRFGQKLVEFLVWTHTNLKLEQRLETYEVGLLPWYIEMTVEEPVSDDDDGSSHRVSDIFMFYIASSHSFTPNMLFYEYHNRFKYIAHVSLRKWVFINQQELFLLSVSKKKKFQKKTTRPQHVYCTCSCEVNSLHYYTSTTVSLSYVHQPQVRELIPSS